MNQDKIVSKLILMEHICGCIQDFQGLLQSLQESLSTCESTQKKLINKQLKMANDNIVALIIPKKIDLPLKGSIQQVQFHVTLTWLG